MKEYYFVYILEMKSGRFYYGMTSNLGFRFQRHIMGEVKSTCKFRPLKVVYVEVFESKQKAQAREQEIKSWKSHKKVEDLISSLSTEEAKVGSPACGV